MKLSTTLATVATLAVSSLAAVPAAPSVPPAVPVYARFAFQGGSCPVPAAASKTAWKHGRPEYDDFTAAAKAANPAQKAQLAAAFVQKYPDSDYKNEALQLEMQAQSSVPSTQPAAVRTAQQLTKSSATAGQLLSADVIIAYLEPNLIKPNDPNLQSRSQMLLSAAECGQQLLSSAPAAQQSQFGPILTKAKGFAQLNLKQYSAAIATLGQAAQQNPKAPLPYYWMGIAEVTQPTPDYNAGIFDLAKASVLSPQTTAISSYLNTVYTSYHGSSDGLQDVLTTARNNTTPPAGFKILTKNEVTYNSEMQTYLAKKAALANALPPADSFPGIKARLEKANLASSEWKQVKGQGYELTGIVTQVTAKTVDVAVGAKDPATAKADIHVVLFAPLKAKRPKIGDTVTVKGVASAFHPNPPEPDVPVVITMTEGSINGYAPAPAKQPGD
ncbi:MAG: hypothetical protein ACRD1Y_01360 [Terriglobales bacterium]